MLGHPLLIKISLLQSIKTCNYLTQPRGYEHAVNALDWVTYA